MDFMQANTYRMPCIGCWQWGSPTISSHKKTAPRQSWRPGFQAPDLV